MKYLQLELQSLIGGSSRQFSESLCIDYTQNGNDYSTIYGAVTVIEQLYAQLRGGIHWSSTPSDEEDNFSRKLRLVTRHLEDLLLNAMEGNDILDLHSRGLLLYQSTDDVC